MNKHRFVLCGNDKTAGWWLKVTSLEELSEYHKEHNSKYGKALENILHDKEYGAVTVTHGPNIRELPLSDAIFYHAMNKKVSVIQSTLEISSMVAEAQLKTLLKQGFIFVNSMGGWCPTLACPVRQSVEKDSFVFPDFKSTDIRISKFPGGQHYYAHIGTMQVRDGDKLKWNTYKEAYEKALECITNDKENEP